MTDVAPQGPVQEGEDLDVEIEVKNTGDVQDSKGVRLDVDPDQDGNFDVNVDSTTLALDPGEVDTVTLTYTTRNGDAPEVDVRGDTDDDLSGAVSAGVTLPPGDVNFVASNVSIDDTSQTFSFTEENVGNNGEIRINLSAPQGDGIDYSEGTLSIDESPPGGGASIRYDDEAEQIVITKTQGGKGSWTVTFDNIDVIGSVEDTYRADYDDDAGNEDASIFEITE